jgi:transposase
MGAYSVDLRERVVAAVERGMPRSEVVATFAISLATLKRWLALKRDHHTLEPGQSRGRPLSLNDDDLQALRDRLIATPDATLEQHLAWWNELHPERTVSRSTIDRAITKLDWTRKKRPSSPANKTR